MSDEENTETPTETPEAETPTPEASDGNIDLPEFEESATGPSEADHPIDSDQLETEISAIHDVPVQVSVVLGTSSMQVSQLLKLSRGAVIELDRKVGEAIDIYVNNRLIARGEVVVVENHLGITMTEIIKSEHAA